MNTSTIESATPDTLADLYALQADSVEKSRLLDTYRGRLERGEADLRHTLLLRTARGVEGSVMFGPAPHPYVFPQLRADAPTPAIRDFLQELRRRLAVTPERQIVLDSARADVPLEPVVQAGWVLDDEHVVYSTDLRARPLAPDPDVTEVQIEDPAIQPVLAALDRAEWTPRGGWTLFALRDGGEVVALGAVGPGGRPGEAGLDLIGTLPGFRGQGFGTRLHAHLLANAAGSFQRHYGGTGASNHAMRRVFEKNGSVLASTQCYFRQP